MFSSATTTRRHLVFAFLRYGYHLATEDVRARRHRLRTRNRRQS